MTPLTSALVAVVLAWLGVVSPAAATAAPSPARLHPAYIYDSHQRAADRSDTTTERGPPAVAYDHIAQPSASDHGSRGTSARLDASTPRPATRSATVVQAAPATPTTGRHVFPADGCPSWLDGSGVAAKSGVGFADDAVASAYQGMRSGDVGVDSGRPARRGGRAGSHQHKATHLGRPVPR